MEKQCIDLSPVYKSFTINGETTNVKVSISITDYDARGNKIHFMDSNGKEELCEYDERGNLIHEFVSGNKEAWYKYDSDDRMIISEIDWLKGPISYRYDVSVYEYGTEGNEIYDIFEDKEVIDDIETSVEIRSINTRFGKTCNFTLHKYDTKGNEIYVKDLNGYQKRCEYDENGKIIHTEYPLDGEIWYDYDAKGNNIHCKAPGFWIDEYWYEYDANGNLIHSLNSNGNEEWREYDANGNLIHLVEKNGNEIWYEYDSMGNRTHLKYLSGDEEWYEYDAKGKVIHYKDSDGMEKWYEYDYYPDGTISKMTEYARIQPDTY